jgi:hypothetical protein
MAENAHAARAKALAEDVADMSKVTAIWVREIEDGIARGGIVWMTPAEVEAWSNERAAAGEG